MPPSQEELFHHIMFRVRHQQAAGVMIMRGHWGVQYATGSPSLWGWYPVSLSGPCGCALSCVIVGQERRRNMFEEDAAAEALGATRGWVIGFIRGFDGAVNEFGSEEYDPTNPEHIAGHQIGKRVWKEIEHANAG